MSETGSTSKNTTGSTTRAFIFDVDGVLLDVRRSFPEVIRQAVIQMWRARGGTVDSDGYGPEHEFVLKRHGAFNDDYDIAWTLLSMAAASGSLKLSEAFPDARRLAEEIHTMDGPLAQWVSNRYGCGVPRDKTRAFCAELYGSHGCGLHLLETPMLSRHYSKLGVPCAVYTGRNALEWELAKESLGWEDFPDELVIHSDSGIKKPSPEGLEILSGRLGAEDIVFFGDTASDLQAWQRFGRGHFAAIGNLLTDAEEHFDSTEEAAAFYLAGTRECA